MLVTEIYDLGGRQYKPAVRNLRFDKIMEGGEDVACGFVLEHPGRIDWPDVGHEYGVVLRKGLNPIWSGHMRHIEQNEETISVTALGNWIHLADRVYTGGGATPGTTGRLWSDTRYGKWRPGTDDDNPAFAPERYEMDAQNRLWVAPRKNENFSIAFQGVYRYQCRYNAIRRVTFNYDFVDPGNWELRLITRAPYTSEWSVAATGAGAVNVILVNPGSPIDFVLYYNAALAQYLGDTGAGCYGKITNLKVYGTTDTTPTVTDIATDIAAQLSGSGMISTDTRLIETIGLVLEPLFYEQGESCLDALEDAASFGDANYRGLAWGVESGANRVFVRVPNRNSVRYVVPAEHAVGLGARGETSQDFVTEGWGSYVDEEGVTRYTAKHYAHITPTGIVVNTTGTGADLASKVYGVLRDKVVPFGRVSAALAIAFIQRYLMEHAHPQIQSRWQVLGQVQDLMRGGAWISPCEMQTGWLVQVPRFRAADAAGPAGADLREWETTLMLAGFSWDDERQEARLIPEGASTDLDRIIDFAKRFREQEEHDKLAKRIRVLGA